MTEGLITVRDWLRHAISSFSRHQVHYGHGCSNPWDEAAWLLCGALSLPQEYLNDLLDARLTREEQVNLSGLIEQRCQQHIPTAYLLKEAWLMGEKFYVDERVIVPRSFIAELLHDQAFDPWIEDPEAIGKVVDVCTGSGCLAILAAQHFPNALVDAVDLSTEALEVAQINVERFRMESVVTLHQGDLYTPLKAQCYDIIFSNPPYVDAPSMDELPDEYRHEPAMALAGGNDGLDLVHTLIRQAVSHLNPGGLLIVEIGHNRETLESAYPNLPFVWMETASGNQFVFLLTREDLIDGMHHG